MNLSSRQSAGTQQTALDITNGLPPLTSGLPTICLANVTLKTSFRTSCPGNFYFPCSTCHLHDSLVAGVLWATGTCLVKR